MFRDVTYLEFRFRLLPHVKIMEQGIVKVRNQGLGCRGLRHGALGAVASKATLLLDCFYNYGKGYLTLNPKP